MTITSDSARNFAGPDGPPPARWWRRGLERRWWTLIAVCGATFMLLVDITIVQVALPTIQRQLGGNFTEMQWVIDAYALTLAALILTCGSVADRLGRKTVFVVGLGVFILASVACGAADGPALLIAARALQGIGGAAMFATGLALIGQEFEGRERGKAIAAWGATVGVAVAVGPLAGGALTDTLGWRWIFWVNAPIGIVTIAVAVSRMVNIGDADAKRLDWAGLITFSGSLFALMLGLLRGNDLGWGSTDVVSLLLAAVLLMLAFVVVERHQSRPMFDLSLFRKPAFIGVSAATFAIGGGAFAMLPFLTFYLQNDLGYSPLNGGLCLLPATLLCGLVPLATRRMTDKLPPGVVLSAGLATTAAGLALMCGLTVNSSWTALLPGMLLMGVRRRDRQPRDRHDRARRGPPTTRRDGLGDQQHVSDRRRGDRGGRTRRRLPTPPRCVARSPARTPRSRAGGRAGIRRNRRDADARAEPARRPRGLPPGLRVKHQRAPRHRKRRRAPRRNRRSRAGPRA